MSGLFTASELNHFLQSQDDIPSGMELWELNCDPTWRTDDVFDPSFPLLENDSLLHPVTDFESEPRELSSGSTDNDSSEPPESGDRENSESQPSLEDDKVTRTLRKVLLDAPREKSPEELLKKLAEMYVGLPLWTIYHC
jgi:hypothetical protein